MDSDFPGGNITIVSVVGDTVTVRPDSRGGGEWFYWYFRVQGAAGRRIRVVFDVKTGFMEGVVGVLGPAVSLDEGHTWQWMGVAHGPGNSFDYHVPEGVVEARFAVTIPYLQADLERYLSDRAERSVILRKTLCRTLKGRPVELLQVGAPMDSATARVLLTARHHACETIASFVLEGVIDAALAQDEVGEWLRKNLALVVVPFVDADGVEDGDPGKTRLPHDYGQDYVCEPALYPEVAALKTLVAGWPAGALRVALDLHCPLLSGWTNGELYFVGTPDQAQWLRVTAFARCLDQVRLGPLAHDSRYDLPAGCDWNSGSRAGQAPAAWFGTHIVDGFAATLEIPYARVGGQDVTPDRARALGRDLAAALVRYLSGGDF